MRKILSLDPGTFETGWCKYNPDTHKVEAMGIDRNEAVLSLLYTQGGHDTDLVLEMVGHYGTGMPVGKEVFHTCLWIGRFIEAWGHLWGDPATQGFACNEASLILRKTITTQICGVAKAKASNIRQALLDRFPATGGGKTPQVGTKKQHGPLYGVKSHIWSALAVAITFKENPNSVL
jgi:hypothetical protein